MDGIHALSLSEVNFSVFFSVFAVETDQLDLNIFQDRIFFATHVETADLLL